MNPVDRPEAAPSRPSFLSVDWQDTNTAVAAMVIGSVVLLAAIRRGFRGFALSS